MNSFSARLTALTVSILCGGPASAQSVFTSNFETPDIPDLTAVYPGDTLLGDWSVTSGSVDLVDINNIWTSGPAFEGTQYIDLDGFGPGSMARTFPTVPGVSYVVTLAYANNYHNQTWATMGMSVFSDSGAFLYGNLLAHSTSQAGDLDWSVFSAEFTAIDEATTLKFNSASSPGVAGGILLDAVSVTQVPEPSAAFLLTGALTALSSRRKRRRR